MNQVVDTINRKNWILTLAKYLRENIVLNQNIMLFVRFKKLVDLRFQFLQPLQ